MQAVATKHFLSYISLRFIARLVEAASRDSKGTPLAPDVYTSIACLYFLPLIEAASRPAGMSGISRDFAGSLQVICQANGYL